MGLGGAGPNAHGAGACVGAAAHHYFSKEAAQGETHRPVQLSLHSGYIEGVKLVFRETSGCNVACVYVAVGA